MWGKGYPQLIHQNPNPKSKFELRLQIGIVGGPGGFGPCHDGAPSFGRVPADPETGTTSGDPAGDLPETGKRTLPEILRRILRTCRRSGYRLRIHAGDVTRPRQDLNRSGRSRAGGGRSCLFPLPVAVPAVVSSVAVRSPAASLDPPAGRPIGGQKVRRVSRRGCRRPSLDPVRRASLMAGGRPIGGAGPDLGTKKPAHSGPVMVPIGGAVKLRSVSE